GMTAWAQLLVEQPDSGGARLDHAQARVSITVSDALRVHAGFRRDAPFAATGDGAVVRGARDRIDAGVAHAGARASFGIDASTAAAGDDRDFSVRTYLFTPDAFRGLELDAAAALFRLQDYSTLEGSVGAGGLVGAVHVRSLYRAQHTTLPLGSALVHELQLETSTALTRRLRGSAALLYNRGGGLAGSRASARVDWTF
ncbi:MAG TPA: hypothetical protein VK928_06425, partial [Longimicrobiales bacterium]|nr:hypothetical protein [Longimicrobiales bacterium]